MFSTRGVMVFFLHKFKCNWIFIGVTPICGAQTRPMLVTVYEDKARIGLYDNVFD